MGGPTPELQLALTPSATRQVWMLGVGMTAVAVLVLAVSDPPALIAACAWLMLAWGVVVTPLLLVRHRRLRRGPVLTIDNAGIHDVRGRCCGVRFTRSTSGSTDSSSTSSSALTTASWLWSAHE